MNPCGTDVANQAKKPSVADVLNQLRDNAQQLADRMSAMLSLLVPEPPSPAKATGVPPGNPPIPETVAEISDRVSRCHATLDRIEAVLF